MALPYDILSLAFLTLHCKIYFQLNVMLCDKIICSRFMMGTISEMFLNFICHLIFRMNRNNRVVPLATRQKEIELLRLGENNARKYGVASDGSLSR